MVVERLATYPAQTFLRDLLLKELPPPPAAPAPPPTPAAVGTLANRKAISIPDLSSPSEPPPPAALAAERPAPLDRPGTPPTPTGARPMTPTGAAAAAASASDAAVAPAGPTAVLANRQTLRRASVIDPSLAPAALSGDPQKMRAAAAATIRRKSVSSTIAETPNTLSELAFAVIEGLCATGKNSGAWH